MIYMDILVENMSYLVKGGICLDGNTEGAFRDQVRT